MSNKRYIIAKFLVDDSAVIRSMETNGVEDTGDIDYFEREAHWLDESGFYLESARIVDDDDADDANARRAVSAIFDE